MDTTRYAPGETFTCTRRAFDPDAPDGLGETCGTEVRMHGCHWVQQVCPSCLACYRDERGTIVPMHGFYSGEARTAILANIASNDGQYVPTFDR